jgi:argininosuccinate lyase
MEQKVPLAKLPLKDFKEEYEGFDYNVFSILGAENAVAAMKSYGSTAPAQVQKQIDDWKEKLGKAYQE